MFDVTLFLHKAILTVITVFAVLVVILFIVSAVGCSNVRVAPTRPTLYDAPVTQLDIDSWPTCAIEGYAAATEEMTFGVGVTISEPCRK